MVPAKNKIIGAFLIGFAIVAGAYTVKNFGQPSLSAPENFAAVAVEAPARVLIEVKDSDNDGLEDWRDQFVKSSSVTIYTDEDYELPNTLTDQVGISFLQNVVSAQTHGAFGQSREEIIVNTADRISASAEDNIFDVKDIKIGNDKSPQALRTYANAAADIINNNSIPGLKNEALILRDVLNGVSTDGLEELKTIANLYQNVLNQTLALSVPPQLIKEHLDLVNVYNAVYHDVSAMTKAVDDPMLTLVRLKRYEEDATGLVLAMQNMYLALEPYASAFGKEDSGLLFVAFSPNLQ